MKTYLFYDLETTGLNFAFDQMLQFAAIRTDENFQELDRIQFKIRLRPDVIPHPRAVLTHRILPAQMQEGLSEYEATVKIHALFNQPGTVSVGYNTLGFDDEFLRFSFYRNLLTPYTHQFKNDCGRADIFPITVMYYLFARETLVWPELNGKPSFKLEHLNAENQFVEGAAHDAMVDVLATLALARKLAANTTMWNYCVGYFNKAEEGRRLQGLQEGLCVNLGFGAEAQYLAPVLSLGQHRHYQNQWTWLRLDQPKLREATLETMAETTWGVRKKLGEPPFILPLRDRFLKGYPETLQAIYQENTEFLRARPELLQAITDYHLNFTYPVLPETEIDAALYQVGFMSDADQRLAMQFHAANFSDKSALGLRFSNKLWRDLAERILWRYEGSIPATSPFYSKSAKMTDYRGQEKLTISAALAETQALLQASTTPAEDQTLLKDLEIWLHEQYLS